MNKKMWKIDTNAESIETENGVSLSNLNEIVEVHNLTVEGLIAQIISLKQEVDHLKYNILIKTYDRTQGH